MTGRIVRRRSVYYVSGFDPRGHSWYYGTYKRESGKQTRLSGLDIEVGPRENVAPHLTAWTVRSRGEYETETRYRFLRWDDVIRRYWPRGTARMWGVMLRNLWDYNRTGVLWRVLKTSWPTFLCAFYPSAFVLLLLILAVLGGIAAAAILDLLLVLPGWSFWLIAAAVAAAVMAYGTRELDRRLAIHWLTRIYAFNIRQARGEAPDFARRLDDFARSIVEEVSVEKPDEVLIVGHSTGAQAALSLMARVLRLDPDFGRRGPSASLVTLGGSISMLSWQPEAQWLRDDLKRVAHEPSVGWLDFTLAQDGACFALHDPVQSVGIDHPAGVEPKPKLLSLKLFDLFSPEAFKAVRRNWFKVHFQYLMAGERLGDYDYFAITAGPRALPDRFAHRESARGFDRFKLKLPRLGRR